MPSNSLSSRASSKMEPLYRISMNDIYDEIYQVKGDLEFGEAVLETVLLNGKNEIANRYLKSALLEIRHALSDLSDAEFEISTTPDEGEDEF